METLQVIELVRRVLHEASSRPAGPVDVVPILVEELDQDIHLVGEVLRHFGGTLLVADDLVDGVESLGEPDLSDLLQDRDLEVNENAGRVTVRQAGSDDPVNPGSRNLLGALTALFAADVRHRPVAAVAVDLADMDIDGRELLWDIYVEQVATLTSNLAPTLLLLFANPVFDADYCCRRGPSLRYALHGKSFMRRRLWGNVAADIAEIGGRSDLLVLFLGAGSSFSSGLPLANDLRTEALRDYVRDDTGLAYEQLAVRFRRMLADDDRLLPSEEGITEEEFVERLTLERVLREEVHHSPGRLPQTLQRFRSLHDDALTHPGPGILRLRETLESISNRLVIVEVNFDQLVEDGLEPDTVRVFVTPNEMDDFVTYLDTYRADGGPVPVVKLHGSIERPETVIATVEQTAQGLHESKVRALEVLRGDDAEAPIPWVYVGYSMRDRDVLQVLQQTTFAKFTDERWVSPLPDSHVASFVDAFRSAHWRQRDWRDELHSRSLTETADVFFEELSHRLME